MGYSTDEVWPKTDSINSRSFDEDLNQNLDPSLQQRIASLTLEGSGTKTPNKEDQSLNNRKMFVQQNEEKLSCKAQSGVDNSNSDEDLLEDLALLRKFGSSNAVSPITESLSMKDTKSFVGQRDKNAKSKTQSLVTKEILSQDFSLDNEDLGDNISESGSTLSRIHEATTSKVNLKNESKPDKEREIQDLLSMLVKERPCGNESQTAQLHIGRQERNVESMSVRKEREIQELLSMLVKERPCGNESQTA
ncbi:hypothetical protein ElyMa_000244900 [Elysia marginata]|uniref:Uncharacterized protein n=1 Tax=Elysia marginata TaxID=1093978 RepID=A0AAV4F163_9GAST|nr:hypothetical protein ElyMa_000244900 [Elysia marginata]